uniref:BHLH domain-containing protein n=1 Tax=Caenorhabditis tropicalis TaxID=1561998 RepID=A0A1I7V2F6_9PELO
MKTPVLTAQNSTIPPVKTPYKKKAGEMKRRMNTNEKFKELEQLVRNQWDGKLKQEIVLRKAFDMVTELKKSASNPHYCGFSKGFDQVRNIVIPFLIYLKMDKNKTENYIGQLEKILPENPNQCSSSEAIPGEEIIDVIGFDDVEEILSEGKDTPSLSEMTLVEETVKNTEKDGERKKRLHMEREQYRRVKLTEAYKNLNKFIADNNLWNGNGKPEKIETVAVTIDFIRASQEKQWVDQQEKLLFMAGQENGRLRAKTLLFDFFQHDGHLQTHLSDLEQSINLQLNPRPLIGFMGPIQLPTASLLSLMSLLQQLPQQPAQQLPLLADSANPAMQDDQENVPPVDKPKIFRPFDV